MAAGTSTIFPASPYVVNASLAAVTACSTRAPTATASLAAANISILCPASTNGVRVDKIQVQACSSSITAPTVAQTVLIWEWDGTTAWVIDEIAVTAVTPSTTTAAFSTAKSYNYALPSTHALYISTTVTTTAATTALQVTLYGGLY